jgi:hypothetical protein
MCSKLKHMHLPLHVHSLLMHSEISFLDPCAFEIEAQWDTLQTYVWPPVNDVFTKVHNVRCQPHVLTYAEICFSVKNLPLTPVKTSNKDELYPRFFEFFYLMSFFSTSLFWDKIKVELFGQVFYYVHWWQSDGWHGGEECTAHAYSHFVWKGGSIYKLKIHQNRLR